MSEKLYELYCQHCCFKQITSGNDIKLTEHKFSPVQSVIPDLDPETGNRKEIKVDEEVRLQEKIKRRQEYEKEQARKEKEKQDEDWANRNKTST